MIRRSDSAVLKEQLVERRERLSRALMRAKREVEERRAGLAAKDPCCWLDRTAEAELERDPTRYVVTVMASELALVEQALGRIEAAPEVALACVRCGSAIGDERLALLPHTIVCSTCA